MPDAALERVVRLMRGFDGPWGVAGGQTLSLWLGRPIRPHGDVDIAILRRDQSRLCHDLRPDDARLAVNGELRRWNDSEWVAPPQHELHLAWDDGTNFEVLLNEVDPTGQVWAYRRDARVQRAMKQAFIDVEGVPCLAPEIVLLYKSKSPRALDDADFAAVAAHLDQGQRLWLQRALMLVAPGHAWAGLLACQT